MGIRFDTPTTPAASPAPTPVATPPTPAAAPSGEAPTITQVPTAGGFTLDLTKGAVLDLAKAKPGLTKCTLAAGWDAAAAGQQGIDLDISAFMLGENGKISAISDVIFFNNKVQPGITLNGDNTTGAGEGDDETIDIDLSQINPNCKSVAFVINIYDAVSRRQAFGMVQNSYVRLLDKNNNNAEVCRYCLKDKFATSTAVIFAKLKRNGGGWEFEAVGEGKVAKDLNDIVAIFS